LFSTNHTLRHAKKTVKLLLRQQQFHTLAWHGQLTPHLSRRNALICLYFIQWHGCCSVDVQALVLNALGKLAARGVPI